MAALCGRAGEKRSGGSQDGGQRVRCTSLKANMGHMEACAAAAGLASLVVTPLAAGVVPTNAQLRRSVFVSRTRPRRGTRTFPDVSGRFRSPCRLNAHLVSLLVACQSSAGVWMPADTDGRADDVPSETRVSGGLIGRLSSFGFSGTITHGLYICSGETASAINSVSASVLLRSNGLRVSLLRAIRTRAD